MACLVLANTDRQYVVLECFTRAWDSKSVHLHLLAKALAAIKKVIKAVDGYLAIGGADQSPKTGPVDSTLALAQASAWEADLPAMA